MSFSHLKIHSTTRNGLLESRDVVWLSSPMITTLHVQLSSTNHKVINESITDPKEQMKLIDNNAVELNIQQWGADTSIVVLIGLFRFRWLSTFFYGVQCPSF